MKESLIIPTLALHSIRKNAGSDLFAVDPSHFEEAISFISERFGTVDIKQLEKADPNTIVSDGKVLVTFDDGYKDNLV